MFRSAFPIQMISEEWSLYLFAEIFAGRAAEFYFAKLVARGAIPAAMIPGAYDQIIQALDILLFQFLIDFQRAIKVFLIPPTRDVQGRHIHLRQILRGGLLLPEGIVIRMIDIIV